MTKDEAYRNLEEAAQMVANSLGDVVELGRFGRAVDPVRFCEANRDALRAALKALARAT